MRDGTTALIWDNVTGVLDSAALASAITAPVFRDRVLGRSESLSIPNRALLLLTGNNLWPAGDLRRRIIPIRIDPGTDTPFARQFDLDPLDYVLEHRVELATSALVLIRGYLSSGVVRAAGRMASFETWDDLVRQTVCWMGTDVVPGKFGDPLDLVRQAQGSDPEQESLFALLEALDAAFPGRWFTAKDASQRAARGRDLHDGTAHDKALANALADIGGERSLGSTRSVGRILQFRQGKIAYGLRLQSRAGRSSREYRVDTVDQPDGCKFGRFGRFGSGDSETGSHAAEADREAAPADSELAETNLPNLPNLQNAPLGASGGR